MAAKDPVIRPTDIASPFSHVEAIVLSDTPDTGDLATVSRAVYVGTGGDITFIMQDGSSALHKAVPQGSIVPGRVKRVAITGTTAQDLVAWS